MMNILITGGNGFIGSQLGEVLLNEGHKVKLFDQNFNWHTENLNVPKIIGSVLDSSSLQRAMSDTDIVIHLAGISRVIDGENNPFECLQTNCGGGLNIARIASELKKIVIFGSSREVFGNSETLPVRENYTKNPISFYGLTKLMTENILKKFGNTHNLRYVIVRFSNVYGSLNDLPDRVVPKFVGGALKGKNIHVFGGQQTLDFTFVDDVALLISKLIGKMDGIQDEDFNIVTGNSISILSLAQLIIKLTGSYSKVERLSTRAFDVDKFSGEPEKIASLLGNDFRIRPIEDGLNVYIKRVCSQPRNNST
jgi:nucleoside-diphosphate-sugar epimerase